MQDFGLITSLDGKKSLPYWNEPPCNEINASEGSFFPPRYYTKKDTVYLYDKDICRTFPLQYRESGRKHGKVVILIISYLNLVANIRGSSDVQFPKFI